MKVGEAGEAFFVVEDSEDDNSTGPQVDEAFERDPLASFYTGQDVKAPDAHLDVANKDELEEKANQEEKCINSSELRLRSLAAFAMDEETLSISRTPYLGPAGMKDDVLECMSLNKTSVVGCLDDQAGTRPIQYEMQLPMFGEIPSPGSTPSIHSWQIPVVQADASPKRTDDFHEVDLHVTTPEDNALLFQMGTSFSSKSLSQNRRSGQARDIWDTSSGDGLGLGKTPSSIG